MKKYGKTFGYFDGRLPNLFTTDVELIRSVFVKDFDNFFNRRVSGVNAIKLMSIYKLIFAISMCFLLALCTMTGFCY